MNIPKNWPAYTPYFYRNGDGELRVAYEMLGGGVDDQQCASETFSYGLQLQTQVAGQLRIIETLEALRDAHARLILFLSEYPRPAGLDPEAAKKVADRAKQEAQHEIEFYKGLLVQVGTLVTDDNDAAADVVNVPGLVAERLEVSAPEPVGLSDRTMKKQALTQLDDALKHCEAGRADHHAAECIKAAVDILKGK